MRLDANPTPPVLPRSAATPAVAGHQPLALALALAACFAAGMARAQPSGAQAVVGSAVLSQNGSRLTVTTQNGLGTNHSAINWQSFSIPAGSSTWFAQPGANSTSINRVTGSNPSAIFGTLGSNGKLVLVNPSGITVGAGAVVDTAGFTASTLRMTDADAVAGRLRFGDGTAAAGVSVGGHVLARSGDVVLLAPSVTTGANALIESPSGAVVLAAGQQAEITGRGLEGIHMSLQAPTDQALNLGSLRGDAVGIFAGTLKHSGAIDATIATAQGGRVLLQASGGDALVSGSIHAAGANQAGGQIDVFGQRVGLLDGAALDASGARGGGSIRVGGDFQGHNPQVPNAQRTFVSAGASLRADATTAGDGGRIIVWADDQTRSAGSISARGGEQGGDGGFVEVSGKKTLEFRSQVDTRAPKGTVGTLLLDPESISVAPAPTPGPTPTPAPARTDVDEFADPGLTVTIDVALINSATSNVVLQANQDISFDAPVSITTPGIGLTAQAGAMLNVFYPIVTNGGPVLLRAGDPLGTGGGGGGALYLQAPIDTTAGGSASGGASITLDSRISDTGGNSLALNAGLNAGTAGPITITGAGVDVAAGVIMNASAVTIGGTGFGGNVWFVAGAPVQFTAPGGVSIYSHEGNVNLAGASLQNNAPGAGPGLRIEAGGSITDTTGASLTAPGRTIALVANQTGGSFVPTGGGSIGTPSLSITTSSSGSTGGAVSLKSAGDMSVGSINASGATLPGTLLFQTPAGVSAGLISGSPDVTFGVGGPATLGSASNNVGMLSGSVGGDLLVQGAAGTTGLSGGGTMDLIGKSGIAFNVSGPLASTGNMAVTGVAADISIGSGATVSAPSITLTAPNVVLAGSLLPGGSGGVGTAVITGNLQVDPGGTLQFDFNGSVVRDTLSVSGTTNFAAGAGVVANASGQPPDGTYVLIPGNATGVLPTLSGSLFGATLAFNSLDLVVAAAPSPTPPPPTAAPTPAPTAAPTPAPTPAPTAAPTPAPTAAPTPAPTAAPTPAPTPAPTAAPTPAPTPAPSPAPTPAPSPAPTPAPTPAPSPAPTPAPAPPPVSSNVDLIVGVLRNGTARSEVRAALGEQVGVIPEFVALLLAEEERQGRDGKSNIVITDTACKP